MATRQPTEPELLAALRVWLAANAGPDLADVTCRFRGRERGVRVTPADDRTPDGGDPPAPGPGSGKAAVTDAADPRPPLTDRQRAVRDFIRDYHAAHGFPPSLRDVMRRFSFSGTNAVSGHLRVLVRKGYLKPRDARRSRALVTID